MWILIISIISIWTFVVGQSGIDPATLKDDIVVTNVPVPLTFYNPSATIRLNPWNFRKYPKLEIEFQTREPNGILFFVGSLSASSDSIGIEIFHSDLFVFGNLLSKVFRIQLNPKNKQVSTGHFYKVSLEMIDWSYITAAFDGVPLSERLQTPQKLEFETYTYIGGVDSVDRLPFIAYSHEGFAGCINYVRLSDGKYINFKQFAGQQEIKGMRSDRCVSGAAACTSGICSPGKCYERSYNMHDQGANFYCDCSGTDKTISAVSGTGGRGSPCSVDAAKFKCDGQTFVTYHYEKEITTHTDIISLDFRTINQKEPLFTMIRDGSSYPQTYIIAELVFGQVTVKMKLYDKPEAKYEKTLIVPLDGLNDGQWHTLKINRFVTDVMAYIDNEKNSISDKLYRSKDGERFYNVVRNITLGSLNQNMGKDKCKGEFRNFYWNYEDITSDLPGPKNFHKHIISYKPEVPVLPPFPREPPHPCSVPASHKGTEIYNVPLTVNSGIFVVEIKTNYNGIVWHAKNPDRRNEWMTLMVYENSAILVYEFLSISGAIQIESTRGGLMLRDFTWHRLVVELNVIKRTLMLFVDNVESLMTEVPLPIYQTELQKIKVMVFSIAMITDGNDYQKFEAVLQDKLPQVRNNFNTEQETKFVGCFGEFLTNFGNYSKNYLFDESGSQNGLIGFQCKACEKNVKCPKDYCQNKGECYNVNQFSIACNCSKTNFHGLYCDIKNPICEKNICQNGGQCQIIDNVRLCNCSGTGYTGTYCEISHCVGYSCQNNGVCYIANGKPTCDCSKVPFTGSYCENPKCPKDFCFNNGQCKLEQMSQLPYCDCKNTGFKGVRCDSPICDPNQCNKRGNCVVRNDQPFCYCIPDYVGSQCETPACSNIQCLNNGKCTIVGGQPVCICTKDFEGPRCEIPKPCPSNACYYGGICTLQNGMPKCNCSNTNYDGKRCEIPSRCPKNHCMNKGQCYIEKEKFMCNCANTGYTGERCNNKIDCPNNFCQNGGVCSVNKGLLSCDCSHTGYSGTTCDGKSTGILTPFEKPGYAAKKFSPYKPSDGMTSSLGFQTYSPTGTLICFETTDKKYWLVKLVDGKLVVDINGITFNMMNSLNDGKYHVLKVVRDDTNFVITVDYPIGETQTIPTLITGIVTLPNNVILYKKVVVGNSCPVTIQENRFQGGIGAIQIGRDLISNDINNGKVPLIGPVKKQYLPMDVLPQPPKFKTCPPNYCLNGGVCFVRSYSPECDCGVTGFAGTICDKKIYIIQSIPPNPGYVVYNIDPPKNSVFDIWRFLIHITSPDSPLASFFLKNGDNFELKMVNQSIYLIANGIPRGRLSLSYITPNQTHVLKVQQLMGYVTLFINDTLQGSASLPESFLSRNGSMEIVKFVVGANAKFDETVKGFIGNPTVNNVNILDGGKLTRNAVGIGNTRVRSMPDQKKPIKEPTNKFEGSHGGVVLGSSGFLFPVGIGFGAIVPAGMGAILLGGFGFIGSVNALAFGFAMAGFLLLTAIIWAIIHLIMASSGTVAVASVPVDQAPLLADAGANMKLAAIPDDFKTVSASPARMELNKANDIMISTTAAKNLYASGAQNGFATFGGGHMAASGGGHMTASGGGLMASSGGRLMTVSGGGYMAGDGFYTAPGNMQFMSAEGGGRTITSGEQRIVTETQQNAFTGAFEEEIEQMNVFAGGEMKIDCCVLSQNSMFAVTGSVDGPPQVWSLQTGSLMQVMMGSGQACSCLCLALDNKLLVGLVAQEGGPQHIQRLEIWNFETSETISVQSSFLCSTFCVSGDGSNIIMADETKQSSITVMNLRNENVQRFFYSHPENIGSDGVQFIKITDNLKYIIAGCRTTDDQSVYMVFNTTKSESAGYQMIDFQSNLQCCDLLSNSEAVTGTDSGELIIWTLDGAKSVRKILIYATLEQRMDTEIQPHYGRINCLSVSKSRSLLGTGGMDNHVKVWNVADETLLMDFQRHIDEVQSVVFSNDDEIIVSGSWDGSIRISDLQTGQEMASFVSNIEISKVLISDDKSVVVALGERAATNKLVMLKLLRNVSKLTTRRTGNENTSRPESGLFSTQ